MDFRGTVRGAEAVTKLMKQVPERTERSLGLKALRAGGKVIIKAARRNLRKNSAEGTGTLSKSIGQQALQTKTGLIGVEVGARKGNKQRYDGWYAHLIEFGTKPHAIKAVKKILSTGVNVFGLKVEHPGTKPKPFLRPAVDENGDEIVKETGNKLWAEIIKLLK